MALVCACCGDTATGIIEERTSEKIPSERQILIDIILYRDG